MYEWVYMYTHCWFQEKHRVKLDSKSEIFQNLNGALDDVQVKFKGENSYLYNMKTGSIPIVVHGNGPVKVRCYSRLFFITVIMKLSGPSIDLVSICLCSGSTEFNG